MPHSVTDGPLVRVVPGRPIGAALYRWRSAPEPTARRPFAEIRSGGSWVHSPSSPPRFPPATGSLCRRATGTRPDHSPFFAMWPGVWPGAPTASSAQPGGGGGPASNPVQRITGSLG